MKLDFAGGFRMPGLAKTTKDDRYDVACDQAIAMFLLQPCELFGEFALIFVGHDLC